MKAQRLEWMDGGLDDSHGWKFTSELSGSRVVLPVRCRFRLEKPPGGEGRLVVATGHGGFTLRRLRGADRLNLQACKRDQQGSRDAAAGSTFVKRVHPVP